MANQQDYARRQRWQHDEYHNRFCKDLESHEIKIKVERIQISGEPHFVISILGNAMFQVNTVNTHIIGQTLPKSITRHNMHAVMWVVRNLENRIADVNWMEFLDEVTATVLEREAMQGGA